MYCMRHDAAGSSDNVTKTIGGNFILFPWLSDSMVSFCSLFESMSLVSSRDRLGLNKRSYQLLVVIGERLTFFFLCGVLKKPHDISIFYHYYYGYRTHQKYGSMWAHIHQTNPVKSNNYDVNPVSNTDRIK